MLIPSTHYRTLVVGDLTFDEAYAYYVVFLDREFGNNVDKSLFGTSKDDFRQVFHLTGGRMWFIQYYINQVIEHKKRIDSGIQLD